MKKIDNKGFTLVELLAVLVILITIMSIAIPTIGSSLERNKEKQNEQKKKLLQSAAELYVTDHKNSIGDDKTCINLNTLVSNGYVDDGAIKDSDNEPFRGCISFEGGTYSWTDNCSGCE